MFHTRKMRTKSEFYSPGGGGINVARVFVRLGGNARSYYMAGGATGDALDGLLDLHQLVPNRIYIAGHTRVASAGSNIPPIILGKAKYPPIDTSRKSISTRSSR